MTVSSARDTLGSDSVRLYLNEIGHVGLLNADEEKDLGQKIKAGISAHEKLSSTSGELSFSVRRRLQRTVKEGEKAKDHMVRANLRLVVSIARRYDRKELQLADLIQEGNIGLMHAADKYDYE